MRREATLRTLCGAQEQRPAARFNRKFSRRKSNLFLIDHAYYVRHLTERQRRRRTPLLPDSEVSPHILFFSPASVSPRNRFWFSPCLFHLLVISEGNDESMMISGGASQLRFRCTANHSFIYQFPVSNVSCLWL